MFQSSKCIERNRYVFVMSMLHGVPKKRRVSQKLRKILYLCAINRLVTLVHLSQGGDRTLNLGGSPIVGGLNNVVNTITDTITRYKKGEKGQKGEKGEKGNKGIKGEKGVKGQKGEQGQKGQKGVKGQKGQMGQKGEKGEKGMQGLKGTKGMKGEKGQKGLKGIKGADEKVGLL